ncbi:hypothetical protein CBL_02706 [Carabus blaptoides fortunei]
MQDDEEEDNNEKVRSGACCLSTVTRSSAAHPDYQAARVAKVIAYGILTNYNHWDFPYLLQDSGVVLGKLHKLGRSICVLTDGLKALFIAWEILAMRKNP